MSYVVISHTLEENVYRLAVGLCREHEVVMLDEQGQPVYEDHVQALDDEGRPATQMVPVLDEQGNQRYEEDRPTGEKVLVREDDGSESELDAMEPGPPMFDEVVVMVPGPPRTELAREVLAVEDFLFAADDERWEGMSEDEIAALQRELVLEALLGRERQAQAQSDRWTARAHLSEPGSTLEV